MKKKQPFVSVVIVNYNGKHFLKECFDSLLAMDYPREKLEIILVDNGSTDGSLEFIQKNYPVVKIFQNDVNNYARANNLGIKHAKGEFIALANNDLVFDKAWLKETLKVISADDRIGAVTGKVLFPDGKLQGTGHYELPDFYWSDRGFLEDDSGQYDNNEEIPSISHCATVYRRACLKDVGPLDEDFNMFLEDVDMALRARQKGWKLLYAPGGRVFHKFHGTAKQDKVDFLCERNRLLLVVKHYPEKLSAALFGKGYFTVFNNRNDLVNVFPELLRKLVTTHDQKTVLAKLPDIFSELEKIINLEKDHLIKELSAAKKTLEDLLGDVIPQRDKLIGMLNGDLARVNDTLSQRDELIGMLNGDLARINSDLSEKNEVLNQKGRQLAEKDQRLVEKDQQLAEKDQQLAEKDQQLAEKDQQLSDKDRAIAHREGCIREKESEADDLRLQIKHIYESETYRFIVKPVWQTLIFLRSFKRKPPAVFPPALVVIKPFCVNAEDTQKALSAVRASKPEAFVILVANSSPADAEKLNAIEAQEKISYSFYGKKLTWVEQIRLIGRLRKRKIEEATVIIGDPVYYGYRKAKAMAFLSGAKKISWHFSRSGNNQSFNPRFSFKAMLRTLAGMVSLSIVTVLFLVFIVFPSKIVKSFRR